MTAKPKKTAPKAETDPAEAPATIRAVKGFEKDWTCRGFKFEPGKTYRHESRVVACKSGFHAIEGNPLEVFRYYPPCKSLFARVEVSGQIDRHDDDSKVAAEVLTVGKEVGLSELIDDAVRFVMARVNPTGAASNTGAYGAASNTGDYGAASNAGAWGAASNTGRSGAASNTGRSGAASNAGDYGAAFNAAFNGKVMGANGSLLVAVERREWDGPIISWAGGIVGQDGLRADTWYRCQGGRFVEVGQ